MKRLRPQSGFTLVELLVVLVIVSLTTSLLVTGLNTTWNNFDKLLARNIVTGAARLPAIWFAQSIRGAQLYHPEKVLFEGDTQSISFVTIYAPDAKVQKPTRLHWQIEPVETGFALTFRSGLSLQSTRIAEFGDQPQFEFLQNGQWLTVFSEQIGKLPVAVRITANDASWSYAVPHRPVDADIPAELPSFGKYEF